MGYASFVFPITVLAVFTDFSLDLVIYIHFIAGLSGSLYYLLRFLNNPTDLQSFRTDWIMSDPLNLGLLLFILGYLFISLLYPIRGWDAMHFYIPNAFYYYLTSSIPAGYNPLNFFPSFKPPVSTLTLMYGFAVSSDFSAQLHPYIFILGGAAIVFNLADHQFQDMEKAKMATIIYFALPLVFFLIYEYAYYQEPPLLFFYSVIFYKLIKISDPDLGQYLIISTAVALAMLCKISGYSTVLLLLLLVLPHIRLQFGRYLLTIALFLFLIRKAVFTTYYLMGIPLVIALIIILYLQYKQIRQEPILISPKNLIFATVIPTIIGGSWIYFMLKIPTVSQFLLDTYVRVHSNSLRYTFPGTNSAIIYIENGMAVSFYSSTLYIVFGSLFGIGLSIFFLAGMLTPGNYNLKIWLLGFWSIWYAYFGTVSGRYLVPLLIPYVLITTSGFTSIIQKLHLNQRKYSTRSMLAFCSGLSFLGTYAILPLRYLGNQTNLRIFNYHSSIIILTIYLVALAILLVKLISARPIRQLPATYHKGMAFGMILIIASGPFVGQLGIYTINGFDRDLTNRQLNYFSRPAYQDLIQFFLDLDIPPTQKLLTVNTPGLEYYIYRSVLDLMIISKFSNLTITQLNTNATIISQNLHANDFQYVISLNSSHAGYNEYQQRFGHLNLFQVVHNPTWFTQVYYNPEYIVYQLH